MLGILFLAAAGVVSLGVLSIAWAGVGALQARQRPPLLPPPPRDPEDLAQLEPQDVIEFEGQSFLVEGVVRFQEHGLRWLAARMVDGADERWLRVQRRDGLVLCVARAQAGLAWTSPPGERLTHDGEAYMLAKLGQARVEVVGQVGRAPQLDAGYWEYEGPGDRRLFVEQTGEGRWEGHAGRRVEARALHLLPHR
jgi:hypothetical protein